MSAETADVLDRAADLVEQGWTQGVHARDVHGMRVASNADSAVCWCATGAISRAAETLDDATEVWGAFDGFIGEVAVYWNDAPGRTQAEVVAALREAATRERGDQ